MTLPEAFDEVDAGLICAQEWISLEGSELVQDWRRKLADATKYLVQGFVAEFPLSLRSARNQSGKPSHYSRRRTSDSELNINKIIGDQLNLLRIVDNVSHTAFFRFGGKEFNLEVYGRNNRTN